MHTFEDWIISLKQPKCILMTTFFKYWWLMRGKRTNGHPEHFSKWITRMNEVGAVLNNTLLWAPFWPNIRGLERTAKYILANNTSSSSISILSANGIASVWMNSSIGSCRLLSILIDSGTPNDTRHLVHVNMLNFGGIHRTIRIRSNSWNLFKC